MFRKIYIRKNDYCYLYGNNRKNMAARSANSSSPALMLILLIITFPFWFGLGAALFGVIIGLCAALFGVVVALFAAAVAIVALPFKLLFGWGHAWNDWGWNFNIDPHFNGFVVIAIIIVIALAVKSRDGKRA